MAHNQEAAAQPKRSLAPKDQHVHHNMLHALANNNGGIWTCLCQKPHRSKAALTRHIAKETGQFACPEPGCSTRSGSKDDLDRHHCDKHEEGKYLCGVPDCKRYAQAFARHLNLLEHYKKKHPLEGEVYLIHDPSTGLHRGSNVPLSDQSSSTLPNNFLEGLYPSIGPYLGGFDKAFNINEGIPFEAKVHNASNNGFTYIGDTDTGPLSSRSDATSPGHDYLQLPQDVRGDGGQMGIQRRISMLQDERQLALARAQEAGEKIVALQRALEVMKE